MARASQRLLDVARTLLTDPAWAASGSAGSPESDATDPDESVQRMAAMFERRFKLPCPPSFHEGLLLPDRVEIRWQAGEIAGEIMIRNPLMSLKRTLDPSVMDWTLEGVPLAETRILDQVTDNAGPFWIVFRITKTEVDPTLYLFDQRDLWTLRIDFNAYLEMAALTRGIVFWQFLFCDDAMPPDVTKALQEGLQHLRKRAADPGLDELDRRLKERSRRTP